jgi:hypothetical protein
LGVLSDNFINQSQTNTVFYKMIKMDWVGVEPTTSASLFRGCSFYLISKDGKDNIIILVLLIFQNNHLENL